MTTSKVSDPANWDVETLIEAVGGLEDARRAAALAVFAHHLTVEIRVVLDGSFPEPGFVQVRQLNEFLHQLTSRLHPADGRSAEDDKSLLDAFAVDAARVGLDKSLKRGLMIAVRNALATAKRPVPAL
ncbi:MAG TPA: hypothetical protein VFC56_17865 [Stellaceae bacterium]|nr:hypothetical protein [Stellaceae bacterium]